MGIKLKISYPLRYFLRRRRHSRAESPLHVCYACMPHTIPISPAAHRQTRPPRSSRCLLSSAAVPRWVSWVAATACSSSDRSFQRCRCRCPLGCLIPVVQELWGVKWDAWGCLLKQLVIALLACSRCFRIVSRGREGCWSAYPGLREVLRSFHMVVVGLLSGRRLLERLQVFAQ